jgi:hypothetical protein
MGIRKPVWVVLLKLLASKALRLADFAGTSPAFDIEQEEAVSYR